MAGVWSSPSPAAWRNPTNHRVDSGRSGRRALERAELVAQVRLVDEAEPVSNLGAWSVAVQEVTRGLGSPDAMEQLRSHAEAGQAAALERAFGQAELPGEGCDTEAGQLVFQRAEQSLLAHAARGINRAQRSPDAP